MFDRCGREIKLGQQVDINLNGTYTGIVVDIKEIPMVVAQGKMAPPQIAIQLILTHLPHDGKNCGVYVISEPEAAQAQPKIELLQ